MFKLKWYINYKKKGFLASLVCLQVAKTSSNEVHNFKLLCKYIKHPLSLPCYKTEKRLGTRLNKTISFCHLLDKVIGSFPLCLSVCLCLYIK